MVHERKRADGDKAELHVVYGVARRRIAAALEGCM